MEKLKVAVAPACGIGHKVVNGTEIVETNLLTPTDTRLRCDAAAQLHKSKKVNIIICDGGIFLPPERQTMPASLLMKKYLVQHHKIPAEDIWIEVESLDSWQNIEFMKRMLISKGYLPAAVELTIVSHYTHNRRLLYKCKYEGFESSQRHDLYYKISRKTYWSEWLAFALIVLDPEGKSPFVQRQRRRRRQKGQHGIVF